MCSIPKEGSNNVRNAGESLLLPVNVADEIKKTPGAMYMKKILNSNMKLRGSIYENGLDPVERKRLANWGDLSINDSPNQVGVFDGKTLTVYDEGHVEASFNGVSGKPGFADWYKKNGKDLPVVVKYRK